MVAGGYKKISDLPQVIPVFPLDGALLLPGAQLPLNIFEPRYLNMIDDVMAAERVIGMIQTREGGDRARPALAEVGCLGRITSFAETQDGRYLITLTGVCRFAVGPELTLPAPYRQIRADFSRFETDLEEAPPCGPAERTALFEALRPYRDGRGMALDWEAAEKAPTESLVSSLCMALPFEAAEKQALLEAADVEARRLTLIALLQIDGAHDFGGEFDDGPPRLQ